MFVALSPGQHFKHGEGDKIDVKLANAGRTYAWGLVQGSVLTSGSHHSDRHVYSGHG